MLKKFNNLLTTTMLNSKMSGSVLFFSSYIAMLTLQNKRKISTIKYKLPNLDFTNAEIIRKYWESRQEEHSYLEEVLGDKAITWVKERNNHSINKLGNPERSPLYNKVLNILDSKDKIPDVYKIGELYYNFWKDINNTRGILRRTTLMSFKSDNTVWETVIDIDLLGKNEKESWVYSGYSLLKPEYNSDEKPSKIILHLSRGGADAQVLREFDLNTLEFITNNGFIVPEAKTKVSWKSNDTLLIGTDLKDGKSLTDSGYPRVVREWKRGTPLEESVILFEGEVTDVSVSGSMHKHRGYDVEIYNRYITFYTSKKVVKIPGSDKFVELDLPDDASIDSFYDQLLISLRSDWTINGETYESGSLLSVSWDDFVNKNDNLKFTQLFKPEERVNIESFIKTKNFVIINSLDNVKSRLIFWKYVGNNSWTFFGQDKEAVIRGASITAVDKDSNDFYWLTIGSFITPSTLYLANCNEGVENAKLLKSIPAQFDATDLEETQGEAISADGTKIPYFMISKKGLVLDGSNPTLLWGYGGFEISLTPSYIPILGEGWLKSGGCYVSANIRGGGEFGPKWHQAGLKENRNLVYDDFIAVAENLISRNITQPKHLGIRGGSNGGLLMGNMMVRRPDLFGAICNAVPLLDMKRYNKLLAGASWMAEYGNPDTDDWKYLQKYSAYHNIDPVNASKTYPALLMTSSTRDDRVHPYHARSFVKRLLELKELSDDKEIDNVYMYENIEGGHGGAADTKQQAFMNVMYIEFLWNTIGKHIKR